MKNRVVCIIPARGASKRIPRKNIKNFLGKPAISYSIQAAISSNIFDEIFVSTDDEEIAKISENYGAVADIYRSRENSNDFATTSDVLQEVLSYPKFREVQYLCCLYPVSPLVNPNLLTDAYHRLENTNCNSVLPITEYTHPIQRCFKMDHKQEISFLNKDFENSRTQDLKKYFHDAGMFYFLRVSGFLEHKKVICSPSIGIELDQMLVQDIDTHTDWKMAELKYQILNGKKISY